MTPELRILSALLCEALSLSMLYGAWKHGRTYGRWGRIINPRDNPVNWWLAMLLWVMGAGLSALVLAAFANPARLPFVAHLVHVPGY